MSKKITKAKAADALTLLFSFLQQELGVTAPEETAAVEPKKAVETEDELDLDGPSDVVDDLDDLDNLDDLGEGLGLDAEPDPRYADVKKLMTVLAKAKKSKDICYKILAKFECKDIDALAESDLDKVIKVLKQQIKKAK